MNQAIKSWLAFLSSVIIERCEMKLQQECPGCQNGLRAPLLHLHKQFNLRETIKKYMQTIVQEFDIKSLFNSFIIKFGYFEISEDEFVQYGQSFVQFSTADAIYFGNYITAELDEALYAEPTYQVPVYEPSPCAKSKKKSDSNENVPKENLINQAFGEPTYPMQTFQPTEKKKRSYNKKVLKGNN